MTFAEAITALKGTATTAKGAIADGLEDVTSVTGATPQQASELTGYAQQLTSLLPIVMKLEAIETPSTGTGN